MVSNRAWLLLGALAAVAGCAAKAPPPQQATPATPPRTYSHDPYPSTYHRYPGVLTAITGGTVFDGEGRRIENGVVILADGVVQAIGGGDTPIPAGPARIDADGKWVTPGVIDVHSHLGDYPSPAVEAHQDGNELTGPVHPDVWAEHSVWPQDPGFSRALANGGVTTMEILPGSANLFGGRSGVPKKAPPRTAQGMKFPGAPYGLKMACGENPKRVYGSKGSMPQTRMGNIAYARGVWLKV